MKADERVELEAALYDLGVIADILTVLAKAEIGGEGLPISGCAVDYLAARQREQHERIERVVSDMWRGGK